MNNGELKQRLRDLSHRADLEEHLQGFINQATWRINRRFHKDYVDLSGDSDSNPILAEDADLYIYAAMCELSHFIRDWEEHDRYHAKWTEEANRAQVLGGSSWRNPNMYIKNELETSYGS